MIRRDTLRVSAEAMVGANFNMLSMLPPGAELVSVGWNGKEREIQFNYTYDPDRPRGETCYGTDDVARWNALHDSEKALRPVPFDPNCDSLPTGCYYPESMYLEKIRAWTGAVEDCPKWLPGNTCGCGQCLGARGSSSAQPKPTGEPIHSCGDPRCDVCGLPGFGPKSWDD